LLFFHGTQYKLSTLLGHPNIQAFSFYSVTII
jgi:hypothetical protein